jgi:hypothetical protein
MPRQSEDWESHGPSSGLGERIGRFMALLAVAFAVTSAFIVTRRLSQDSLALLIGLSCGVMAMLPTIALVFLIWRQDAQRRQMTQQYEQGQRQFGYQGSPPVIVVTPQGMPGDYRSAFGAPNPAGTWMPRQSQRSFTIVGDEE